MVGSDASYGVLLVCAYLYSCIGFFHSFLEVYTFFEDIKYLLLYKGINRWAVMTPVVV